MNICIKAMRSCDVIRMRGDKTTQRGELRRKKLTAAFCCSHLMIRVEIEEGSY